MTNVVLFYEKNHYIYRFIFFEHIDNTWIEGIS